MSKNLGKITGVKPASANTALIVLDMITDFDFEDGDQLYENTVKMAPNLAQLIERARGEKVPVLYVNDNFGKWQEDFPTYVKLVRKNSAKGREVLDMIEPRRGDYHILKPQRSAFFSTPLEVLLLTLEVSEVVMTGITTDICILFSAHDAYMRGYRLQIPSDCTAAVLESYYEDALKLMRRVVHAETAGQQDVEFK